jgi:predicted amidohydrolase
VVGAARVRLGIAICYELEIAEYSAALADRGAVNDEEVAVAPLELGGYCSRSIPARYNRAVTSRSGRPHGPADQPVSQTVG